jgi:hypothetical protein
VVEKLYGIRAIRAARLKKQNRHSLSQRTPHFHNIDKIVAQDAMSREKQILILISALLLTAVAALLQRALPIYTLAGCTQGMRSPHVLTAVILLLYCCFAADCMQGIEHLSILSTFDLGGIRCGITSITSSVLSGIDCAGPWDDRR